MRDKEPLSPTGVFLFVQCHYGMAILSAMNMKYVLDMPDMKIWQWYLLDTKKEEKKRQSNEIFQSSAKQTQDVNKGPSHLNDIRMFPVFLLSAKWRRKFNKLNKKYPSSILTYQ